MSEVEKPDPIETTGKAVYEPPTVTDLPPTAPVNLAAAELAIANVAACGRDKNGNMIARPVVAKELATASPEVMREAIRITMNPSWLTLLPALDERLETLDETDLRMLLILSACYWCQGRIQGTLDERLKTATTEET